MNQDKVNRSTLKSYFEQGDMPTEANFASLIDGIVNFRDDGLAKRPGQPLSVESAGDANSEKPVLNFFNSFAEDGASWSLCLNPHQIADDPTSAKVGLAIKNAQKKSVLFIDAATGNIGIDTQQPQEKLHVNGNATVQKLTIGTWPRGAAFQSISLNTLDQNDASNYGILFHSNGQLLLNSPVNISLRNKHSERIRIDADSIDLQVDTNIAHSKALSFGSVNRQMLNLYAQSYGVGVQSNTLYFRSDNDFAWHRKGVHTGTRGAAGTGGSTLMKLTGTGRLGVGINTPAEAVDVNGKVKIKSLTIGAWPANGAFQSIYRNNLDQTDSGNYNLLFHSTGTLYLNSPSTVRLRYKNGDRIVISESKVYFSVDTNIDSHVLSFGSSTRQMLNLYGTSYGVGVQSSTLYSRSNAGFAWYLKGVHSNSQWQPGTGGTRLMWLDSAGNLKVKGTVKGTSISDIKLKKEINRLDASLEKVLRLKGVDFQWRDPAALGFEPGKVKGFVAQEVEKVFPEWVTTNDEGYKCLMMEGFEAVLTEAIRELHDKVRKLEMQLQS